MHISNPLALLMMKFQGIKFGKNCKFYGLPYLVKTKNSILEIGDNLTLISSLIDNLAGVYQRSVILAREGAIVEIGNNVSMSGVTIYSFNRIHIGDNTMIGVNTKIFDSDMHPISPEIRRTDPNNREETRKKPVVIGNNVFIGANCLILKGVTIGNDSVVGAGSVVTSDVPPRTIVAGNPARVIKNIAKEI